MKKLFVTATGTDIGKTFVTTSLAAQLRADGRSVLALKPVATGFDPRALAASDTGLLLAAQGLAPTAANIERVTPWRFAEPLSPDMAAARERRPIDFAELVAHCCRSTAAEIMLIEGIGGVMTPLDDAHTVLDWITALDVPVVLVTGSYLGTLSHTLTALGMLRQRGSVVAGIVISESLDQPLPAEETARSLAHFVAPIPLVLLSRDEAAARPRLAALLDRAADSAFRG